MSGRPEGSADGGYGELGPDDDRDAWQDFTPWRPGDASTRGEAPPSYAADYNGDGLYRPALENERGRPGDQPAGGKRAGADEPRTRWWTEGAPRPIAQGDRVSSRGAVGGGVISNVPAGTAGQVTSTRSGALGGEYATVEFSNGYTEEVRTSDLQRERGWF